MTSPVAATTMESRRVLHAMKLAQTAAYFVTFIALGLSTATIGPTLSGLAQHTHTALSEISILFTVRAFGYMVGSLVSGRLYDRVKGHPVMVVAFLVMATMLALVPLLSQLWVMAAVMLVLSVADGTVDVGGNTLLVWARDGDKIGPAMNALHFFFGLGAFISPILIAQVIRWSGDINWAYWLIPIALLPIVIWIVRLPSPGHPSAMHSDDGKTQANTRMTALVVLIAVFFFLIVGMEVSFAGWIASYAVAIDFGDEAAAAVLTSGFWGAFMLARLLSIPMAARLSARMVIFADLAGCILSALVILLSNGSSIALWIGTFGFGLSMAALFPTMISFAEARMKITGKITSIFLTGSSLGGMTLPWVVGQLFEPIGPDVMVWTVLITAFATAVVFIIVNFASKKD